MTPITEEQALQKLMNLCARSEHSSGEMQQKMRQWQLSDEAQARILQQLTAERYVDDERFARAFVKDKLRYNHWGRRKIQQALWAKGIGDDIQQQVLSEIPDDDYLQELIPALRQKARSLSHENEFNRQMKLLRFAQGRGFSLDQAEKALRMLQE